MLLLEQTLQLAVFVLITQLPALVGIVLGKSQSCIQSSVPQLPLRASHLDRAHLPILQRSPNMAPTCSVARFQLLVCVGVCSLHHCVRCSANRQLECLTLASCSPSLFDQHPSFASLSWNLRNPLLHGMFVCPWAHCFWRSIFVWVTCTFACVASIRARPAAVADMNSPILARQSGWPNNPCSMLENSWRTWKWSLLQ